MYHGVMCFSDHLVLSEHSAVIEIPSLSVGKKAGKLTRRN